MNIKPMQPEGLKQSPQKPINHVAQKVEVEKAPPIDVSLNLWDVIRLGGRKGIENKVYSLLQANSGKIPVAGGFAIGGILGANINWGRLLMGDFLEILKLIGSIICIAVGWFWKK